MENLRGEQELRPSKAVPDPYRLPPWLAQKHRVCNGEPER